MASLQYCSYDGVGKQMIERHRYSQAVRVPPNRIECAGQGGWDPSNGVIPGNIDEQIDQAFANVDLAIKTAGGKGWGQVFRVNSYHIPMDDAALSAMARNFKKWMPDHCPIWTCVGVPRVALEAMKVEIEVVAIDE